jgi:hypothetical protein
MDFFQNITNKIPGFGSDLTQTDDRIKDFAKSVYRKTQDTTREIMSDPNVAKATNARILDTGLAKGINRGGEIAGSALDVIKMGTEEVARTPASAALSVRAFLFKKVEEIAGVPASVVRKDVEDLQTFDPDTLEGAGGRIANGLFDAVFGDRPLQTWETRIAKGELNVIDAGRMLQSGNIDLPVGGEGYEEYLGGELKKNALPLSIIGTFGLGLADIPTGGKTKVVIKTIAETTDAKIIAGLLKNTGIVEDLANATATRFAKLTDEKAVELALNNLVEVQKTAIGVRDALKGFDSSFFKDTGEQVFEGFSDVTTRVLKRLEGKSTISKGELESIVNNIKGNEGLTLAEEKILRKAISEVGPVGGKRIPVQSLADVIKSELLPLKSSEVLSPKYGDISIRGYDDVASYQEILHRSPIQTSAGDVHFAYDRVGSPTASRGIDNYFSHTRYQDLTDGSSRRFLEIQSDLFQKDRLPRTISSVTFRDGKKTVQNAEEALTKLSPYRNTWWKRTIREDLKMTAADGKTTALFPTGQTAMKIEGLGTEHSWSYGDRMFPLTVDTLKVGKQVNQSGRITDEWIITDVLGDGKFKAVSKDFYENMKGRWLDLEGDINWKSRLETSKETFDISGKIDTSNPIYRFYEGDIKKFLKQFGKTETITDAKGNTWVKLDVDPKLASQGVEAFGGVGAGLEQDQNGEFHINPVKAAIGVLAAGLGIKYGKVGVSKAAKVLKGIKPIENNALKAAAHVDANNAPFELPEETTWGYIAGQVQDQMRRLGEAQSAIKSTGKEIPEELDAYLQQELYVGRVSEKIQKFRDVIIQSPKGSKEPALLERMVNEGIDFERFGKYMQARHAKERNARVATLNPNMLDGGSGMTNAEADEILQALSKDKVRSTYYKYYKEFKEKVLDSRLKILEDSGLEKPDTIQRIKSAYRNYVPLKVVGKDTGGKGTGKGFSVAGKNIFRVKGSTDARVNPFVSALVDYERTLIKEGKNEVALTFKRLIEENPNDTLWTIEQLQYRPRFDKNGEIVSVDPRFKFADNVLEVREGGQISLIEIKDSALAKSMKKLGTEKAIPFLNNINSYLRMVVTAYNPEFMISNFARDIQTTLVNVGGEQGSKIAGKVTKDVAPAMHGVWDSKMGRTGYWADLYDEMKMEGGKVGWFDSKTVDEKSEELIGLIRQYQGDRKLNSLRNMVSGIGEYVSSANEAVESGVRLAVYKNMIDAGASKAQAASTAKNITVNFNKKGNLGAALNSLYLFSNAGIQGTARIFTALKHPKVRKIVAAGTAFSIALNEANNYINGPEYNKIPDYEKDKNWIFMFPNGNYIKVPLPYGYNMFKILGDATADTVSGRRTAGELMSRLIIGADSAFNPLGSGTISQLISPTVLDPFVQIGENKNFFGGPIKPDQSPYTQAVPESQLYFSSVSKVSLGVSEWLNRVTGGNTVKSGVIDWSPEYLDHLIDFVGGGAGQFISNVVESGVSLTQGELPDVKNIPFLRRTLGQNDPKYDRNLIYEIANKSEKSILTKNDIETLRSSLKNSLQNGLMDTKTASKVYGDIVKNQNRVSASDIFQDMLDSNTEERRRIYESLDPATRREIDKLIKEYSKRQEKLK